MMTNELKHHYIPGVKDCTTQDDGPASARGDWAPLGIERVILPSSELADDVSVPRYPQRHLWPSDRYAP